MLRLMTRGTVSTARRAISFELTETQQQLQQTVLEFSRNEIIPVASKFDKSGEYPTELAKKAFELGIMNAMVPAEYGGIGLTNFESAIATEALSYGCSGIGLAICGSTLPMMSLLLCGNNEQKKKYLGMLAEGPNIAALAVTEPAAGSDVSGLKTKAVKEGDEYVINGNKCWITGAGPAKFFVVLARTDTNPKTPPGKAFTMFIVDGDSPGITRGKKELNMGQRASDTRALTFENVRVKKENIIGVEGGGFAVCMRTFDGTRPMVGAIGCGISWRALEEAVKYSMERKTFGTHIANHQAVQFMIADMATSLENFRLMTYKSATYLDMKNPDATYFASIAKLTAADHTQQIVSNAVQVFGGAGFNSEYPVEKLMRDAKILQIYEGTSQIQRIIIARKVFENFKANNSVLIR